MSSKSSKHFLIVGAGLSGLCVGLQLSRSGQRISIAGNGVNNCSRVAAGMINPLVFRRMTKSWRVDDFIPYLKQFYSALEEETGIRFLHEIANRRMFSSEQERDFWLRKQQDPAFHAYMNPVNDEDMNFSEALNDFGSGRVKNCFWIDTEPFLAGVSGLLEKRGALMIQEEFNHALLNETEYKGQTYDAIIFCEGYLSVNNPWFRDLPINQTKGEVLLVHSETLPETQALNRKCFVLPKGEKIFKVGSTYHWHNSDLSPTVEGCQKILSNLRYLTHEEVVVLETDAGIRPTTFDRRPLIGTHPIRHNYHIFNGLGTKGYMIAPLLSEEFANYLLFGTLLDPEVDIRRTYPGR